VWDLGPAWTIGFVAAVVIAGYAVLSAGLRRATGVFVLLATTVEGVLHRKLLPLFAIAWLCYVPSLLQETGVGGWLMTFLRRRSRFMRVAWTVFACLSLAAALRQKPWQLRVPQAIYPVGAVEYLARHDFHGNVMVPFRLGAYVSWKLYPAVKVSLDSRYEETYPDSVVQSIFGFYEAVPGWRSTLDAFPTDLVLVPRDVPLAASMSESGWNRVYLDQQFELFGRPGKDLPREDKSTTSFNGVVP
jgi:hypothetical protein